jgi:hypothetical protein
MNLMELAFYWSEVRSQETEVDDSSNLHTLKENMVNNGNRFSMMLILHETVFRISSDFRLLTSNNLDRPIKLTVELFILIALQRLLFQ